MSGDASPSSADQDTILRAGGVVYTIEVETEYESLDWLDHTLLELTQDPQPVDELFAAFPLPARLLENALSNLLQRNLLLLEVQTGRVRASHLSERPAAGSKPDPIKLEIWQDHSTGILLPAEQVANWASGRRRGEEVDVERESLRGGPPRKTPQEMSHAELLHRLQRFRPDIARTSTVHSFSKEESMTLEVRARRRPDGRLAIKEAIPWPLRAAWAKLGGRLALDDEAALEIVLPATWGETVGAWLQESYDRIRGSRTSGGALSRLRRVLGSQVTVARSPEGVVVTKRLAREARSSLIVGVSAGHGTAGEAVQVLQECPQRKRILLLSGIEIKEDKRQEWEQGGIRVVQREGRPGPDFLLMDGRVLAFGGIHSPGAGVWTIRSGMPLGGYEAWLGEIGIDLDPVGEPSGGGAAELDRDLRALESDIQDLIDSRGYMDSRGETEAEARSRAVEDYLKDRCRELQARLGLGGVTPASWVPPAEVLGLVELWKGPLRVLVRDRTSPLAVAALARDIESAVWLDSDAPVDCVLTDKVILLGFSLEGRSSSPEFLAVNDGDLASRIRIDTANLPRLS